MKDDWLNPNIGAGLRTTPGKDSSVGPMRHGEIINPPRMAVYGGLVKLGPIGYFKNMFKLKKSGSDING